jgi:hypothetical protein
MSDDYLFDGTGVPDPDVERLERTLGRLRSNASVPAITVRRKPDTTDKERCSRFMSSRTRIGIASGI